jgi:hypothetical protein
MSIYGDARENSAVTYLIFSYDSPAKAEDRLRPMGEVPILTLSTADALESTDGKAWRDEVGS